MEIIIDERFILMFITMAFLIGKSRAWLCFIPTIIYFILHWVFGKIVPPGWSCYWNATPYDRLVFLFFYGRDLHKFLDIMHWKYGWFTGPLSRRKYYDD